MALPSRPRPRQEGLDLRRQVGDAEPSWSRPSSGRPWTTRLEPAAEGVTTTSSRFPECERIGGSVGGQAGLEGLLFWDNNSSLLCLGNANNSAYSGIVSVTLRSKSFSTALFAQMEELQQETGLWSTVERVKLLSRLETKVELRPNSWKMLRLSRVTPVARLPPPGLAYLRARPTALIRCESFLTAVRLVTYSKEREGQGEGAQPPLQGEVRPALPKERELQGACQEVRLLSQEKVLAST